MSDFTPGALAAAMTQALRTQTQFKGKIDVPAPAPFEGHSDDAQAFIDRVLNYFDATGNSDAADQSKIAFAFSLMKGSAQNFRDLYETEVGGELWGFLTRPDNVLRMETASQLERAALEPLASGLVTEFGDEVRDDRTKQMLGHMTRQIMEARGNGPEYQAQ